MIRSSISIFILIFFATTSCFESYAQQPEYLKFSFKDLISHQPLVGDSIVFLSQYTLRGELMTVRKDETDNRLSSYDEVYYVHSGRGKLSSKGVDMQLEDGTIVFVPRSTPYRFTEVMTPVTMLRLISYADKGADTLAIRSFSAHEIESGRLPNDNAWNPFVKCPSMTFGLYMLPKPLNGDSALVHLWDEVNLVSHGKGKFQVNKSVMNVEPGDIIFVRKGVGHYFHTLLTDLDILIFFEKKSVEAQ
jgi:mannose-6-phosphate isomerase-like protein (cupin superfamily)